jgi:hypothetical protein
VSRLWLAQPRLQGRFTALIERAISLSPLIICFFNATSIKSTPGILINLTRTSRIKVGYLSPKLAETLSCGFTVDYARGGFGVSASRQSEHCPSGNNDPQRGVASSSDPRYRNTANLPTGFTGTYGVNLAPNNDGLSLQQGSPGIDQGIVLGSSFAGSVNSVGRPAGAGWDIGAYEYNSGGAVTPPAPTNLRIVQ